MNLRIPTIEKIIAKIVDGQSTKADQFFFFVGPLHPHFEGDNVFHEFYEVAFATDGLTALANLAFFIRIFAATLALKFFGLADLVQVKVVRFPIVLAISIFHDI